MKTNKASWDYDHGYLGEESMLFNCRVCGDPTAKPGGLCYPHATDLRTLRLSLHNQNSKALGIEYFDLQDLLEKAEVGETLDWLDRQNEVNEIRTAGHPA